VIKGKLKKIATWFAKQTQAEVKVFVDTAPLMEKPLAHAAGLGWQGKHTNLLSRELGSWFFIGTILTDMVLPPDAPEVDHCGSCHACLDICPTKAFPAPYQLDARRCISYLTIEHKGHIDREFRRPMGNRIFGCDDCLAVCPWNKFAQVASEAKLRAREDLISPDLDDLASLDDAAFRKLFSGSPVKRVGRDRFVRNVLIAIGNSGSRNFIPVAERLLNDTSPLVRAMAVWALAQLMPAGNFQYLRTRQEKTEPDLTVKAEWSSPNHLLCFGFGFSARTLRTVGQAGVENFGESRFRKLPRSTPKAFMGSCLTANCRLHRMLLTFSFQPRLMKMAILSCDYFRSNCRG
jgi:epoxyqueuosine reductase